MMIFRETHRRPKVVIYQTRPVSGPGSYKLDITTSKRLAFFRGGGEDTEFVWRSPD